MTDTAEKEVKTLEPLECKRSDDDSSSLTVGSVFKVECKTPSFVLNPSRLKIETQTPYQLFLLESEAQPDGRLFLKVTSYRVGEFKSTTEAFLSDGVNKQAITGVNFKVESVIDPKNPPKGPYGPMGGHILTLPNFYLWAVIGLMVLILVGSGFRLYRRWQRKRLIEGLKKHDSRLSPLSQLHARFRQAQTEVLSETLSTKATSTTSGVSAAGANNPFATMDDILRVYVIRQFKIPAQDWSDRLILNDFKARFAFLGNDLVNELKVLLRETKKNKNLWSSTKNSLKDWEQLVKKIKRWADQVDRNLNSNASRNLKPSSRDSFAELRGGL